MDLYKLLFFSIHIPTILLDGDLLIIDEINAGGSYAILKVVTE